MNNVYKSIVTGLNEAIEDAQEMSGKLHRDVVIFTLSEGYPIEDTKPDIENQKTNLLS